MKKNIIHAAVMLAWIGSAFGQYKQPVVVKQVWSSAPNEYAIVSTTIKNDPEQSDEPIITRKVVGYVSATEDASTGRFRKLDVNERLLIPQKPVSYQSDLPDLIGKLVGTVGNTVATTAGYSDIGDKIEASGEVLAAITNYFIDMAGDKMTEFYGMTQTTMNFIELLPSQYYVIEKDKVVVKDQFFKDFDQFQSLKPRYIEIVQEYNKLVKQDIALRREYNQTGANNPDIATKIKDLYNNQLKPVAGKKFDLEQQLSQFGLQRFAFIPDFREPKKSCGDTGYAGPWSLNIYTYIGAKQTNIANVDYCVRNPDDVTQNIIIELLGNRREQNGNFVSGGIIVRNDDKSVVLPKSTGGSQPIWNSSQSNQLDWYSSTLVADDAGTVKDYMLPFDIYKFEKEYEDKVKKERSEKNEKLFEKLKEFTEKWKKGDTSDLDDEQKENVKPKKDGESKKSPLEEKRDELKQAIKNSINQGFVAGKLLEKRIDPTQFNDTLVKVNNFINENLPRDDRQLNQTLTQAIQEIYKHLQEFIQYLNTAVAATQAKNWDQATKAIRDLESANIKTKLTEAVSTVKSLEFGQKESKKAAVKDIITDFATQVANKYDIAKLKAELSTKQFAQ